MTVRKAINKLFVLLGAAALAMSLSMTAYAGGTVTYEGNARQFIFEPGSPHSPTNLFDQFSGVMPGDSLTQQITVRNDASGKVKARIYMRSLGAHEDSEGFLSQLRMTVAPSDNNGMAYMFDAAADQTDGLTDWVLLGTVYSGGEVNLEVTLEVPITLGNEYQKAIGYLDWQFRVEELPAAPDDPKPPQTGDHTDLRVYIALACVSGAVLAVLIAVSRRKERKH